MTPKPGIPLTSENDARFHGMLGAWDHPDEHLPDMMLAFADNMPVEYRGWAEMIRGWAYRIEREAQGIPLIPDPDRLMRIVRQLPTWSPHPDIKHRVDGPLLREKDVLDVIRRHSSGIPLIDVELLAEALRVIGPTDVGDEYDPSEFRHSDALKIAAEYTRLASESSRDHVAPPAETHRQKQWRLRKEEEDRL